jgi:hypothetical protein
LGIGFGLLAVSADKSSSKIAWGFLGASCFYTAFSKKERDIKYGAESIIDKDLNGNIAENNRLRKEIIDLKEQIKVKQEIQNEQE